jgi:hypothetical protein
LFTLGSLCKITKEVQILGILFPMLKVMHSVSQKNGLGYILGDFFSIISGHTDHEFEASFVTKTALEKCTEFIYPDHFMSLIMIQLSFYGIMFSLNEFLKNESVRAGWSSCGIGVLKLASSNPSSLLVSGKVRS